MLNTIGYEGAKLQDFVATLRHAGVEVLVDVRERAQSRRPGFSKTALRASLEASGIRYLHFRVLGDPKDGRDAARRGDWSTFRKVYDAVINSTAAQSALDEIEQIARTEDICLMCYERDPSTCHRTIISSTLESRLDLETRHLGVQKIDKSEKRTRRVLHPSEGSAAQV